MAGRLVLIRHGEPAHATAGVYGCHQGDQGLTAVGEHQARLLNVRLRSTGELGPRPVVVTSRLGRAMDTAALALEGVPVAAWSQDCGVCELHGGDADGLNVGEREARFGPVSSVLDDPDRVVAPNGESWNQLMARAGAALQGIVDRHPDDVSVVVTHSGVVAASYLAFARITVAGVGGRAPVTRPPGFTSVTVWEWDHPGEPVLAGYNDIAHLHGLLAPPDDPEWARIGQPGTLGR